MAGGRPCERWPLAGPGDQRGFAGGLVHLGNFNYPHHRQVSTTNSGRPMRRPVVLVDGGGGNPKHDVVGAASEADLGHGRESRPNWAQHTYQIELAGPNQLLSPARDERAESRREEFPTTRLLSPDPLSLWRRGRRSPSHSKSSE